MFLILNILYKELIKAEARFNRDPRMSHLPLLGSPWPMVIVCIFYLLLVKKWGPAFMKNRKPFDVKLPMQLHNALQVVLNAYVFYGSLKYSYMLKYFSFTCQEYNTQDTRDSIMTLRYSCYVYYVAKYLDLFDTVFFVLRKKYNQITFLHVYHHTLMVYAVWAYSTLLFGSHFTATGVLNSFVHICMYLYYYVAALKLNVNLTHWKRRLTQLQLVQFCCLTLHFVQPIINNWCKLDLFWSFAAFGQNFFMLILFSDFYYKTYLKKKTTHDNKELTKKSIASAAAISNK